MYRHSRIRRFWVSFVERKGVRRVDTQYFQERNMSNASVQMKLANPAPLGLAGFALTTWLLSMINAGWFSSFARI